MAENSVQVAEQTVPIQMEQWPNRASRMYVQRYQTIDYFRIWQEYILCDSQLLQDWEKRGIATQWS